jgi:flagellar biosynthetic protein FlhB
MIIPVCLTLMVVALIVSLAQVGFLFTFHPITPDLQKLDPLSGFFRIFSMESLFKLAISLFKVGLLGIVSYVTIKNRMGLILNITDLDYIQIGSIACSLIFMLGIRLGLILFILAIIDYVYTRFKNEKQMRMSKQELKEELRRMEGDPLVKERRRRVARQLASQRMQLAVPKADVIVTNPTELAIALKYDSQTMAAPKVVAKGAGFVAAKIRQIAIQNRIPIIERKPLAQALYKTVEIGQEIPPSFYKAVAEILAYVYELTGKPRGPAGNNPPRTQTAGARR